jgi:hypothetical protein
MRYRACCGNPQFCDAWHIDGFPEDYFELRKENPSRRARKMFGLEIIGALGVLLLVGSFTALQFRWLTEIAKA